MCNRGFCCFAYGGGSRLCRKRHSENNFSGRINHCNPSDISLSIDLKSTTLEHNEHIHKSIIEACKKGKEKARFELYQLYSKAMFNVCYRMMNNREEAEDMLQEAFTQAFMKLDTFRYESGFGTWLKRIVVNTCINAINKKKVELSFCEEIHKYDQPVHEEENEMKYTVGNITKAMEMLPEGGRMVFSLYLLEGYDHTEIAQIMNITESTSKSQFMRAKRRVAEILKEQKSQSI